MAASHSIKTIISGGQTGVDQAALAAARCLNLETGGYMPPGFQTEDGSQPELKDLYGMVEMKTYGYPARTRMNIITSNGTLIFRCGPKLSPGTRLTEQLCLKLSRPYLILADADFETQETQQTAKEKVLAWIQEHKISVLNVAGSRSKEYYDRVYRFILFAFKK